MTPDTARKVQLVRFRVREGAKPKVEEWMRFLSDNMAAVLETLEPERMFVETIFSETVDGRDYLYWYTVQGEGGSAVEQSPHWLDQKHLEYWRACIDDSYPREVLTTQVMMIPARVADSMRPLPPT